MRMKPRSRRNIGNAKESSAEAEEHFIIRYLDLSRMIEVNDFKRFQSFAAKADLNALQTGNKPFLFYAIQKDDQKLAAFLLDQEIDLFARYPVSVEGDMNSNENTRGGRESRESVNSDAKRVEMNALEYAIHAKRDKIVEQIETKLREDSLEDRWIRVVANGDVEAIEHFQKKFKASEQLKDFLQLGLVKGSELGSSRLIDYFIGSQKLDLNYTIEYKDHLVSPLLIAIENKKTDAAKYLIFRKANINLVGEYGNALVTAIHYECSNELITILLEKGASLASRHRDWPSLNLREYCIQLNKVKAKSAIDDFVFRLIANGEYEKLKSLADNGYLTINVMNRFKKTGRDLAIERYHLNIVQLIDKIEYKQRRLKTKMNY